jgi:hypothetical protein
MTFALKLSRWVAQAFSVVGTVAALAACAGDPTGAPVVAEKPATDSSTSANPNPNPNPAPVRGGYYASPSGSSSANGSKDQPWSLTAALAGGNGKVQPGDTVWLRGGTYRGTFTSTVSGASGKPVVFRQYPGEHALIDGAGTAKTGVALKVSGSWVVLWGFEMTNSEPTRTSSQLGNGGRAHALANYASHTKYISLVVHDFGVGIYNESQYSDVEIVGCVFYNNGWQGPDRGHGHAIYLRSNDGPVTARDNVRFNQFGYGVHVFTNPGEGQLNNIRIEGNVSFNSGGLANNYPAQNILVGGDDRATGDVVKGNMTYFASGWSAANVRIGYGSLKNGSVDVRDNYFAGGGPVLNMGYWSSATASGNTLIGTSSVVSISDPSMSASLFSGQTSSQLPTTTKVFVRKVPYETGRVNVVVYNWGKDGSVTVNLAGMLPNGSQYEVHNVQDLNGSAVASGTFNGGSVTVPIRSVQAPVPVGWSKHPGTGTEFSTFIVTIRQ